MKDRKILKKIVSYPLKSKFTYLLSLFLFGSQNFAYLAYVSFVQFYAISIIENDKWNEIIKAAGIVIILYGIINAITCIGMLLIDYVRIQTDNSLKYEVLIHTILGKVKNIEVSDISSRLINDVETVASFVTIDIGLLLMPIICIIGFPIILFMLNVRIGLVAVCTMLFPLIYNKLVLPKIRKIGNEIVVLNSQYIKKVSRGIHAFSTIKLFNLVDKQVKFTEDIRQLVRKKQVFRSFLHSIRTLISNISNVAATLIVMIFSIKLYNSNNITLAEIVIIPQLLSGMISGVEGICSFSLNMQQPIASAKRIFEIIDNKIVESTVNESNKYIKNNIESVENAIEIKKINFGYDENNMIISNLSFNVKNGEIACLIGPIGCGKSTVIKLLLGFLDEKSGIIKVFGKDKKTVNEREWYTNFAFVEQEPSLFNLSIEENILLGNQNEDLEKMNDIVEIIGLNEILQVLPEGIKTIVGSRGAALSGGQRQLISVARALYSNAPIVILDEFSSAMDKNIEKKVLDALQFYKKDKTFLIVSHRKSSLKIADKVIEIAK